MLLISSWQDGGNTRDLVSSLIGLVSICAPRSCFCPIDVPEPLLAASQNVC